ncbi:hypothetical protein A2311_03090 [candidate division WOR-1 bacterium RIFOXYB2_FULL_48_7]|uniref:Response regulatory domain-containing protein n=1 Tax=candidate division WOR-1 bacterium RIFOXYB2_FULL_48_7 TaxID=1802583 RepID=A0A1F4TUV2_UNCSA|nr:MAG: hypothetical protein A2311_03090 [candidate division WOR-1 bacterium RIFOXYB2_FULL_48_7]
MDKPIVLIIDDEVKQTDMVAKLIESTGRYQALKAYNASEGIELLKKNRQLFRPNKIRLILLDIKMPEMDGLQFLSLLRKEDKYSETGVIMLTAYEDEDKWDKATSGFVSGYLKKPVKEEELVTVLDHFFSHEGASAEMTMKTFEQHIAKREEFKKNKS